MTECALRVKHTCAHDGKPLAVVDGLPGGNADLSPKQMRVLALALLQAADDCEDLCRPRSLRPVHIYPLVQPGHTLAKVAHG